MPKHLGISDQIISVPSGLMTGTPLVPTIDVSVAKEAMGLATVATTGVYSDLTGRPSIPSSQVQSDWLEAVTSSPDYILNKPPARSSSSATRSLVTTTASTGFQPSSTRDVLGSYSVMVSTTATIAGSATGTVFLEVAATNSTTPSAWTELSRLTNGQALSLAVTLQSVQTTAGILFGFIPAGYYARLRTQNVSGTPSFSYSSGSETFL